MNIIEISTDAENKQPTNQCGICGATNHQYHDCNYLKITQHVPDSKIPSRAKLTMPHFLQLQILTDGSYSLITKSVINEGTKFGPICAVKTTQNLADAFSLKVFPCIENNYNEYYLDTTDENQCNWLIFVSAADDFVELNMLIFQERSDIYYVTTKNINPGETLKAWYSPYYASKMNKHTLTPKEEINTAKAVDVNVLIKKQQKIMERKIWTCKFCSHMESSVVLFAKHILKHYTAQLKRVCEICNKGFGSKKGLQKHLKIVHNLSTTSNPKPVKPATDSAKTSFKDVALGGPLLNDVFNDSTDLQQTDLNQFDISMDNHNLLLENDNLTVENLLNENVKDLDHFNFEIDDNQKQFVCDICLKQFTKAKFLIIHLRHHTGDFMCYKCLKVFCRNENLKSHMCNAVSYYACNLCHKRFTQRKYLSRHRDAIHNKKFSCSNCNKAYHSSKELLEHNCSRIPNEEKETFICSMCDKTFYREIYLKKHMKTHTSRPRPTTSQYNSICEVCGLHFARKNSYYLHKKTHKEPAYSCETCHMKFYRKDVLNQHVLSHETIAKFECQVCLKKFKTNKVLKAHQKCHSSEKNFECTICGAMFKRQNNLSRHVKLYHRADSDVFEYYVCPICNSKIKLKSSLLRHLKKTHKDNDISVSDIQPQYVKKSEISPRNKLVKSGQEANRNRRNSVTDNSTKSVSTALDVQINNLLNDTNFAPTTDNNPDLSNEHEAFKEVCLSIPDLTETDQEITLDKNAYILDNGTIIQPQQDSDNVTIYVLDHVFS